MKYLGFWPRLGLATLGGIMTYVAAEADSLKVMLKDPDLAENLTVAILTTLAVIEINQRTVRWVDRLLPFYRRQKIYYIRRYTAQALLSGLPTLIAALLIGYVTITLYHKMDIGQTSFFQYDIYLNLYGIIFLQGMYAFSHYARTRDMPEYAEVIDNARTPSDARHLPEGKWLLEEDDRDYKTLLLEVADIRHRYLPESTTQQPDQLTWKDAVDGVPLEEIAFFYIEADNYFFKTFDGAVFGLGMSLTKLMALLPEEHFFLGRRQLIVSQKAIREIQKLPESRISLRLEPAYEGRNDLSRMASRTFKKWYRSTNDTKRITEASQTGNI